MSCDLGDIWFIHIPYLLRPFHPAFIYPQSVLDSLIAMASGSAIPTGWIVDMPVGEFQRWRIECVSVPGLVVLAANDFEKYTPARSRARLRPARGHNGRSGCPISNVGVVKSSAPTHGNS